MEFTKISYFSSLISIYVYLGFIHSVTFLSMIFWLVVDLPLWKIWVRQLGLLFPIYGKSKNSMVPNHQPVFHAFFGEKSRLFSAATSCGPTPLHLGHLHYLVVASWTCGLARSRMNMAQNLQEIDGKSIWKSRCSWDFAGESMGNRKKLLWIYGLKGNEFSWGL